MEKLSFIIPFPPIIQMQVCYHTLADDFFRNLYKTILSLHLCDQFCKG